MLVLEHPPRKPKVSKAGWAEIVICGKRANQPVFLISEEAEPEEDVDMGDLFGGGDDDY